MQFFAIAKNTLLFNYTYDRFSFFKDFFERIFWNLEVVYSELNDEQRQLQESVRRFTQEEIIPQAAHFDQTMEFPWPIIKKAHENGFMNADVPTEYGNFY